MQVEEIISDLIACGIQDDYARFEMLFPAYEDALQRRYGSKLESFNLPNHVLDVHVALSDYFKTGDSGIIKELVGG